MTNHSYHFKVTNLSVFAVDLGFLVEEYAGSKGAIPPRKRRKKRTLYIATIEKAHSLVNSLIQDQRIANVGLVVVDEVGMLPSSENLSNYAKSFVSCSGLSPAKLDCRQS